MSAAVHPYNAQNYPHRWADGFCAGCRLSRKRVAEDDPYPCRAAMPTLNADGSIAAEWCPAEFTKAGEPNDDHMHCDCWYECEPCCRCGDDTPDASCDCPRCTAVREGEA
jgi:hypothetical protein